MEDKDISVFCKTVWDFYKKHKRDLPWRNTENPYHILVSEVMLQQTQVDRVISYYHSWLKRFPDLQTLARASFSQIYPFWQGLGYNRRAMALQKLAQVVVEKYEGNLPSDVALLEALPGIGLYTARAVAIFAFNRPFACIETNIRRVYIHHFFADGEGVTDAQILKIAERAAPRGRAREWHWALMDYGSHLRSTLSLSKGGNPNRRHKNYTIQSKFKGSLRQIRGGILKKLAAQSMTKLQIEKALGKSDSRLGKVLATLEQEGFIAYKNSRYKLR